MEEACQKLEALQERERSEASEVEKVAEELLTYEFSVVSLRQELQEVLREVCYTTDSRTQFDIERASEGVALSLSGAA
jgi:formate dehydrogenase maturation protein FdhE